MRQSRSGTVGNASVVLAAVSYYPSIAPFTPALALSLVAFALAMSALARGAWRRAILSITIVVSTVLVSPLTPVSEIAAAQLGLTTVVVASVVMILLLTLALLAQYGWCKKRATNSDPSAPDA